MGPESQMRPRIASLRLRSDNYMDLNRCANVRETVSFSGRDLSVITG